MSQLKGLIAGLVQNPGLLRSFIDNPQGLANLAGLGEAEINRLSGVTEAVSRMLNRVSNQNGIATAQTQVLERTVSCPGTTSGSRPARGQGVAVAAVVSLLTVAGAVAVLGTVSLVALAGKDD
jgi:hypothetical protein